MDNDAISKSTALKLMDKYIDMAGDDDQMHHAMCVVAEGIKELPALDVAPVVRCKDCLYRGEKTCPMYFETREHGNEVYTAYDRTADNGYCEIGRRRKCD